MFSKKQKTGFRGKETEETTMDQMSQKKTCDTFTATEIPVLFVKSDYETLKSIM